MSFSKAQRFALWYMLDQERRYPLADGYPEDFPSRYIMGGGGIRMPTLRALEKQGLVEPFDSKSRRPIYRRGSGVIPTARIKVEKVTRWRLTEEGRTAAEPIQREDL